MARKTAAQTAQDNDTKIVINSNESAAEQAPVVEQAPVEEAPAVKEAPVVIETKQPKVKFKATVNGESRLGDEQLEYVKDTEYKISRAFAVLLAKANKGFILE